MAVFTSTKVRGGLDKIGAQESKPKKHKRHIAFRVYDDMGIFLGETYMSHGGGDIDDHLLGQMAKQLHITPSLIKGIVI